ncbi:hypothetical protein D3C87_2198310 [compost metagenome]
MLCSAARTMRRLFTAASMESDRSMSSLIALRKNSCSRSQRSWWLGSSVMVKISSLRTKLLSPGCTSAW